MKTLLVIASVFVFASAAGIREKRCPGGCLGSMLAQGCVVTGNQLYANGIYIRNLNSTEINQLDSYTAEVANYKNLKQIYEEDWVSDPQQLPDPPKTPSFCTPNITTQYLFDGCVVQNNKVYVGGVFARNLTSTEVRQLQDYAQAVTEYEAYVTKAMQQRMEDMRAVFSDFGNWRSRPSSSQSTTTATTTSTSPPLTAPTPPNFCTSFS